MIISYLQATRRTRMSPRHRCPHSDIKKHKNTHLEHKSIPQHHSIYNQRMLDAEGNIIPDHAHIINKSIAAIMGGWGTFWVGQLESCPRLKPMFTMHIIHTALRDRWCHRRRKYLAGIYMTVALIFELSCKILSIMAVWIFEMWPFVSWQRNSNNQLT